MSNILDKIAASKREYVDSCIAAVPYAEIEKAAVLAQSNNPVRGFYKNLSQKTGTALITEIKKASPSKGLIREDFNPPLLAKAYEDGGSACLSVLTDVPYFQGSDQYLIAARNAVSLPALRKDFMIDAYQIIEARALGADCILLIMAMLSDELAKELEDVAISYNLDVLIEVHDAEELERAHLLKSPLMGINNRNLKTFDTSIKTTLELAPMIEKNRMCVSESGIFTADDIKMLGEKAGVNCFLIGESLMRQQDVTAATKALLS
jgi:indole-3-glycerol phosphate synthase